METTQKFDGLIQKVQEDFGEKIVALRRDIHREPELGFGTGKTAGKVLEALDGLPLEIQSGVAENGIIATLEGDGEGPTVGLRADMDALPIHEETGLDFASQTDGKMHACGHDGHTSMLVGAVHALSGMRDRLNGTVKFFFQPAEEGGGGGRVMVEEGAADDVDSIFALHLWPGLPFGTAATKPGPIMAAADAFEMTVETSSGHGAMPHLSVDAVTVAAHVVTALQTIVSREVDPVQPAVLTIGEIEAGTAFNIIPGEARLGGTVRTLDAELRQEIPRRMEELSRGVGKWDARRHRTRLHFLLSGNHQRRRGRLAGARCDRSPLRRRENPGATEPLDGRRRFRLLPRKTARRLRLARHRGRRLRTPHPDLRLRRRNTPARSLAPRRPGSGDALALNLLSFSPIS